jgi:hypothetical protein
MTESESNKTFDQSDTTFGDGKNQDRQGSASQKHETSFWGITVLILVAVIAFAVIRFSGQNPSQPETNSTSPETQSNAKTIDNGNTSTPAADSDIQVSENTGNSPSDRLPSGLLLQDADITQEETDTENGRLELVVGQSTDLSNGEVFDHYKSWMRENGFTIKTSNQLNGILVAEAEGVKLAVISDRSENGLQVRVNYLLPQGD